MKKVIVNAAPPPPFRVVMRVSVSRKNLSYKAQLGQLLHASLFLASKHYHQQPLSELHKISASLKIRSTVLKLLN